MRTILQCLSTTDAGQNVVDTILQGRQRRGISRIYTRTHVVPTTQTLRTNIIFENLVVRLAAWLLPLRFHTSCLLGLRRVDKFRPLDFLPPLADDRPRLIEATLV
jgi:hypothetical protein